MNKSIFNETFYNYGGILNYQNQMFTVCQAQASNIIKSYENSNIYLKTPPKLYFNFINNIGFNGKANISENNMGLIGLYGGCFLRIYNTFFKILSHSETLKHIGNYKDEVYSTPIILDKYINDNNLIINFEEINNDSYLELMPKDINRSHYGSLLVDIAFEFLFNHEATHIMNGHLLFLKKLPEFKNHLSYQTLEMDADSVSICKILYKHIKRFKKEFSIPTNYEPFYKNIDSLIYTIVYSISTLFKISSEENIYLKRELTDLNHSKPIIRQTMFLATIDEYIKKHLKEYESNINFLKVVVDAVSEVEANYKAMTGKKFKIDNYAEAKSDKAKDQFLKIKENWKLMRPKIEEFSFIELVKE
jgi:hypothetical protein